MSLNIVITGQKSFGRAVLKRLVEDGHNIVGVAVAPQGRQKDRMVGLAMKYQVPILAEADKLTSRMIPANTDLIVSAHSWWLVSNQILNKCKYGGIGFHPSLLPRHRGQDAVRWTIKMRDPIGGGTIYKLNDKTDGGEIVSQELLMVKPQWNYHQYWEKLFPVGVDMVSNAVKKIEKDNGIKNAKPQDEDCATWEPSFKRPRLKRNELLRLS